jgi:hypothetical protein
MPRAPEGASNEIKVRLTHYYPYQAGLTTKQRLMEGKPVDRKGRPLTTLEQHFDDPAAHPFVDLAGDPSIFPYGQKLLVPWGDRTAVGRVTDTGGHFHGVGKLVRAIGYEPLDVCVATSSDHPPKTLVTAQAIVGDHLDKASKMLALSKAGQPVVGFATSDLDLLGAENLPGTVPEWLEIFDLVDGVEAA